MAEKKSTAYTEKSNKEYTDRFLKTLEERITENQNQNQNPYNMCYDFLIYDRCERKYCKYGHDYAKLNIRRCKNGDSCNFYGCFFLHPYENLKSYCIRLHEPLREQRNKRPRYHSPQRSYGDCDYSSNFGRTSYQVEVKILTKREIAVEAFTRALLSGATQINVQIE